MRVAALSVCFGNYRNETKHGIDRGIVFDPDIDYYFLCDDPGLRSKHWQVVVLEDPENVPRQMTPQRWNAKLAKWGVPQIVRDYDLVIWMDSKLVVSGKGRPPVSVSKNKVEALASLPTLVWNVKHWRDWPEQELDITLQAGKENKDKALSLRHELVKRDFRIGLADTCLMIYRPTDLVIDCFARVLRALEDFELKRDQNVFNLALHDGGMDSKAHKFFCACDVCPDGSPIGGWCSSAKRLQRRHGLGDRFQAVNPKPISLGLYIPFGTGYRLCVNRGQ